MSDSEGPPVVPIKKSKKQRHVAEPSEDPLTMDNRDGEIEPPRGSSSRKKRVKTRPAPVEDAEESLETSYTGLDPSVSKHIRDIAKSMSYRDDTSDVEISAEDIPPVGVNPFDGESLAEDPRLDPNSDSFDSRMWIRCMKRMMDEDPDHFKPTALGVAFRNLRAYGRASDADYQATVFNAPFKLAGEVWDAVVNRNDTSRNFDILKPMDGLIRRGTLTVVLGRPGAGCTTFLKTIAAQTHGFKVASDSVISYDGLKPSQIRNNYRGDVTYSAESDVHFPHLTVGQTLKFAADLRVPQNRPIGLSRDEYAQRITDVYMAMYGLSHTVNTKVGNEFVRGVSGGERKRVSIAEVSLCGSYLQCWDNATRGLDSATALEFIHALKTQSEVMDVTSLIAIYQCSQDAYDLFDDCILLYEGYQIYTGPAKAAKDYFVRMGWECPARQTTADFLTSITNPAERVARKGYENKVPRTPKQFYEYWMASKEHLKLVEDVDEYIAHCQAHSVAEEFAAAHRARQADHTRKSSSFTVSYWMQIRTLVKRNWLRTKGAPGIAIVSIFGNILMSLILASLFYNLAPNTSSFYTRGAAMFFGVLFNCFSSLAEIMALFEARPIIEKHKQYALYHPSAEALASIIMEFPSKVIITICFNVIYYFMINFKREPGAFFFYLLMCFLGTLSMSHLFRTVGSFFSTLSAAMAPASIVLLALSLYAGFAIPTPNMLGWSRWINYINPVAYVFESLMTNEFQGRNFPCTLYTPSGGAYDTVDPISRVCGVVGAVAGQTSVNGDSYLLKSYDYRWSNRWRNFGIVIGFIIFFLITYLLAAEANKGASQRGEVALFPRNKLKKLRKAKKAALKRMEDIEAGGDAAVAALAASQSLVKEDLSKIHAGTEVFHWRGVCYDVQIGKETRRILSHVDGWIKPGTLTALMGASGAGKTTLLDVLASRVTVGTIYGHMFVNGHLRDASFQRSTGYAQQQDLHLQTSTVREALRFSAYLRQPKSVSREEKNAYVETVINVLEMESYADAIIGVPGEGLNVEQRKRLTIGVELAARPTLLLFLDEPTSGLDSQTAWSVCQLMRKLADNGQAVLCTIHQPSAILMESFDRLLFLAKGGKTVYFGDLGEQCRTLISYFERNGAPQCPPEANPVEWMLEVIGAAPGSHANQDYHEVWLKSKEYRRVQKQLLKMEKELGSQPRLIVAEEERTEFAASSWTQYVQVTKRVFEQYYRTPTYIWSKILLTVLSELFNGFTFYNTSPSLQGMQNQMLSVFMFTVVIHPLVEQMLPHFISQRTLYEARERPSKTFSWPVWLAAQITAELPWQIFVGTLGYFCWFYPVGFYKNAQPTNAVAERSALTWLLVVTYYCFISTFGQFCAAAFDAAEIGANMVSLLYTIALDFCGVLKYPSGFWIWMYYISPFTYFVQSMMAATIGNNDVKCSSVEFVSFAPPANSTCAEYMNPYISFAGGYLANPDATENCRFCTLSKTNTFLKSIHTDFDKRWRNWGIFFCYVVINVILCFVVYYLARVPKGKKKVREQPDQTQEEASDELEPSNDDDNDEKIGKDESNGVELASVATSPNGERRKRRKKQTVSPDGESTPEAKTTSPTRRRRKKRVEAAAEDDAE